MYQYTYRPCKQKHAIIEDFYTDDDFVIEDECIIPETFSLGTSRVGKRVRLADTYRDKVN